MNDTLDKKFYLGIARSLLATGQYRGLAQRYIDVLHRRKVLRRGAKEAMFLGRKDNPLAEIHFKAPLSVAGQLGHKAKIAAEHMIQRGVPIATELDSRGIHRGTSLGDVTEQLRHRTGKVYNEIEVLHLYQAFMSGHPKLLGFHPLRRYRSIPTLSKRLEGERNDLECRLHQALMTQDGRIFAVCVAAQPLAEVLEQCEDGVVVGFSGTGSKVRVNGTEVPTLWGVGKGLAVIGVDDLRSLLNPGAVIGIEANLGGWLGYTDLESTLARAPKSKSFRFYGSDE